MFTWRNSLTFWQACLSIFTRTRSSRPFLLLHTGAQRETAVWVITHVWSATEKDGMMPFHWRNAHDQTSEPAVNRGTQNYNKNICFGCFERRILVALNVSVSSLQIMFSTSLSTFLATWLSSQSDKSTWKLPHYFYDIPFWIHRHQNGISPSFAAVTASTLLWGLWVLFPIHKKKASVRSDWCLTRGPGPQSQF